MNKNINIFAITFIAFVGVVGCGESSTTQVAQSVRSTSPSNTVGTKMGKETNITDPNGSLDVEAIPPISKLNEEQRHYVVEMLGAIQRVVDGTSTLEDEEKLILGEGQFFWPKNPSAPVKVLKSFSPENFRMRGISLSFNRASEGARWTTANFSVQPINFPDGIYKMDLPKEVFKGYRLVKVEPGPPSDGNVMRINLFHFVSIIDQKSVLTVVASADVSSLQDSEALAKLAERMRIAWQRKR
ncbi:MAG: hypothetical protein WKG03_10350, partial [Telluria sp.]